MKKVTDKIPVTFFINMHNLISGEINESLRYEKQNAICCGVVMGIVCYNLIHVFN
jgi:hypothetical protein